MLSRLLRKLSRWLMKVRIGVRGDAQPGCSDDLPMMVLADLHKARAIIDHAIDLTSSVSQDVGKHSDHIQSINSELAALATADATVIAGMISKLLGANHELQDRLEQAEQRLAAHTRELEVVANAARTDSLTGLMNRRALDEEMQRCVAEFHDRNRPTALLFLDVDLFKNFNDAHGHLAGDQALVYLAQTLVAAARPADIVARFGGEEFVVLFPGMTALAASEQAEQMRQAIGNGRIAFNEQQLRITASGGLADLTVGDDATAWLKRADAAMYAAKHAGRDCLFWHNGTQLERLSQQPPSPSVLEAEERDYALRREAAAELADEAFGDTTFVQNVARRIAEWRRGGSTFSVILGRLDLRDEEGAFVDSTPAVRLALHVARHCIRDMDLLTKWRDDGLAVLLPGATAADARRVGRRMQSALARSKRASPGELAGLSMSLGIAEGIQGNDAQRVLQRAWLALAAAREAGGGVTYVHDGIKTCAMKTPLAAGELPAR